MYARRYALGQYEATTALHHYTAIIMLILTITATYPTSINVVRPLFAKQVILQMDR